MTKLNDAVDNLLERVGNRFAQTTGKIPLKDAEGKDLPTLEGKVEIIDNQLSITVGGITVPIRIIHVFDHVYTFRFSVATLPRASLDTNDIFRQIIEIFHAVKPEVLEIKRRELWDNKFSFDIASTDGRSNRKFTQEVRAYMRLRRRIKYVEDLRTIIVKAITTERQPNAFFFKMKNNDEITLFCNDEFQTTESILSHIDKDDASLAGFEIKITCFSKYDMPIHSSRLNKWRVEEW